MSLSCFLRRSAAASALVLGILGAEAVQAQVVVVRPVRRHYRPRPVVVVPPPPVVVAPVAPVVVAPAPPVLVAPVRPVVVAPRPVYYRANVRPHRVMVVR